MASVGLRPKKIVLKGSDRIHAYVDEHHTHVLDEIYKRRVERNKKLLAANRSIEPQPKRRRFPRLLSNACPLPPILQELYCQPCGVDVAKVAPPNSDDTSLESDESSSNKRPADKKDQYRLKIYSSQQKNSKKGASYHSVGPSIWLEGTHEVRPRSTATIFLKTHYSTEDEKVLGYVPYFGEDDNEDVVSEFFDVRNREQLMESGPEYVQNQNSVIIDEVLKRMKEETEITPAILEALADIMDEEDDEKVQKRWHDIQNAPAVEPKKKPAKTSPKTYEDAMDTYGRVFCRRCYIYDCNMHQFKDERPDLNLQYELSTQLERDGHWEDMEFDESKLPPAKQIPDSTPLTDIQKAILPRAFLIFQANLERIASTIGASEKAVRDFVNTKQLKIPEEFQLVNASNAPKRKGKKSFDQSMNNYSQQLLKKIEEADIHPYFEPCNHTGICTRDNCACARDAFFCTKHCIWGRRSQNFFRGCACNGKCTTKSCSCYAAKRECDPDLCKQCGTCSDPPNAPAVKQRCRNDNIGMRRHCHLLMGISTVENAGWGVFTRYPLKKGDFVHEYVGEVISQEEAERRGRIYDKVNRSYLFNLSSDFVVDASRKGNKTRFANHSRRPNCETKYITVNGDMRIGLFAREDIEAQSELFFDYRYDVHMDNEYIIKPAQKVDWMEDPKMANKISKKK